MTGNMTILIEDDVAEIEKLIKELEDWSSWLFESDWRDIENSGSTSSEYYKREKDAAWERNDQRHLTIEKLRARLLCE